MEPRRAITFGIIFLAVSFLGLLDAGYLSVKRYRGETPPCTITRGCEKVTTSKYSQIAGIPVTYLGAINYAVIFIMSLVFLDTRRATVLRYMSYYTAIGFLFSGWFTFVQAFLIKSFCQYCLFSAFVSTVLFMTGMVYVVHSRRARADEKKIGPSNSAGS